MSFAARLVHDLTHVHIPYDAVAANDDEYGQPDPGAAVSTSVKGLVQPKSAREMGDTRSAGSEVGDHVIFLAPMALDASDHFVHGDDVLQITGIRRFEFGHTPHLEVDAVRVTAGGSVEEGS